MVVLILLAAAFFQTAAQRASSLVDAGVELSHRGRFFEAAEKFVQALALDPNLAEAHYLLGLVRQQEGRIAAARQSFGAAVKIDPRYAAAQARVCELDTVLARAVDKDYDRALTSCRRAVQLDASDPESHFHSGWLQAKLGNGAIAVQEFNTTLRLDPKFPKARFELAMSYMDQRDPDRAIPLLEQVVKAEPINTNAKFQLGSALVKKNQCEAAIPWLQAATESSQRHYLLARCYQKLNRAEEAAAELAQVRNLMEGSGVRTEAQLLAAQAHQKAEAGELDHAIENYRAALQKTNDPTLTIDLAVALLKKGDAEEVIRLLGSRTDALARYQIALAHSQRDRFDQARTQLMQAVHDKPDFVEAWYQLGIACLRLGNIPQSERALRTAAKLRPDESAIRLALAEVLQAVGLDREAREQRDAAASLPK